VKPFGNLMMALALALPLASCGGGGESQTAGGPKPNAAYTDRATFTDPTKIDNPHAPITKFRQCEEEGQEGGAQTRVVRKLLERTQPFTFKGSKVDSAVVEDSAFEEGELVERTIDYFAQDDGGTVYYFGEDVNNFKHGKVTDHDGSWRLGRDTDIPGVLMPANPKVGDRWHFEYVPGITIESDLLTKRLPRTQVRGKTYEDVLMVRETLEREGEIEGKLFARGFGILSELQPDGRVDLVRCTGAG
jgi:hypothetical protein